MRAHSFKQNLSPAWLLGPQALGKLLLMTIHSFKQNLSPAWLLGPQTLGEIITYDRLGDYYLKEIIFSVCAQSSTITIIKCTVPKTHYCFDRCHVFTLCQMFKIKEHY